MCVFSRHWDQHRVISPDFDSYIVGFGTETIFNHSVRDWTSSTHQTGPALQSPTAVFIEMISKCDIDETPGSTPDVVIGQHIHKSRLRGGEEEQAAALSSNSCCAAHTMNILCGGNRRVILKQKDDIYLKKKNSTGNLNSSVIVTKLAKLCIALAMCNYEILQMKKSNLNNPRNLRQIQSTCSHILRRK